MEVAELLVRSTHRASRSLIGQRLQSDFEPVQCQLYIYRYEKVMPIITGNQPTGKGMRNCNSASSYE